MLWGLVRKTFQSYKTLSKRRSGEPYDDAAVSL